MKTPKAPEHLNVESLRKWLDDYEATWTEQDKEYMGEFKHTPIRALVDIKDGGGIADGAIYEHAGLGFVIVPKYVKSPNHHFTCPQCGGHEWGTSNLNESDEEHTGHCHTYGCKFKWNRETEDEKYVNG